MKGFPDEVSHDFDHRIGRADRAQLEAKARERGVSVELYARKLLQRDAHGEEKNDEVKRKAAIARARGMLKNDGRTVDDFLRERREEAQREIEYSI